MIVFVKKELPAVEYYSLFCGESIRDLWERIKADGLLDKYRSLLMMPQFEEQRNTITSFNNEVTSGNITKETFASYLFPLDNCVYSCLGISETESEEAKLLIRCKNIITNHSGISDRFLSRYIAEIDDLLALSSEQRQKKIFGEGKIFLAYKR